MTGAEVLDVARDAIITLLKTDSVHQRVFVGEAGTNYLRTFDWNRRLLSTQTLPSPPIYTTSAPWRLCTKSSRCPTRAFSFLRKDWSAYG